jgi:hypothetical protein
VSASGPSHGSRSGGLPDGPVFVGGLDRSGKTTMAAFLTSHPRIAIPPVGSNMETYFLNRFGDLGRPANRERCLSAMMRYSHIRILDPDLGGIRRWFAAGPPSYERLFAAFLQDYAERLGKPRWGAQSGLIEAHAEELFAAHEDAKVVHMVRDPRDRYEASLSMWPDGKGKAGGATARWRYSTGLAERNRRRHPHDYLVVRFEDLVHSPERILREVCSFLGEAFAPEMLAMGGALERRERLMARSHGDLERGFLSEAFVGRYRDRVSARELAFIQLHAGRRMAAFGYRSDELEMSFVDRMRFALGDWPQQAARMTGWRVVEEMHRWAPARIGRDPDPKTIVDDGGDR